MLLVITGNGKGKTTSAIGTAMRSIGWGKKVAIIFFDKGGSHYGEQHILNLLQDKIDTFRFGQERFNEKTGKFRFKNTDDDKKEAQKGIKKTISLLSKKYDLVICDELINCLNLNLTDRQSIQNLIDSCPINTHLILTGRNTPNWLIKKADLLSEVKEVKHYFKTIKKPIKGLDY